MERESNFKFLYLSVVEFIIEIIEMSFEKSLFNLEYIMKCQMNKLNEYSSLFQFIRNSKKISIDSNTLNIINMRYPKIETREFIRRIYDWRKSLEKSYDSTRICNKKNDLYFLADIYDTQEAILTPITKNYDLINMFNLSEFEEYVNIEEYYLKFNEIDDFYSNIDHNFELMLNINLNNNNFSLTRFHETFENKFEDIESGTNLLVNFVENYEKEKIINENQNDVNSKDRIVNRKIRFSNESLENCLTAKREVYLKISNSPMCYTTSFTSVKSFE